MHVCVLRRQVVTQLLFHRASSARRSVITLANRHKPNGTDAFFHLGLTDADAHDFSDVKFVCTGGSAARIRLFAEKAAEALADCPGVNVPFGFTPAPIGKTDRYEMYKVGPVLIANHNMGMPTTSILLHEVTKLLAHAGAEDPVYIRMGTCGGIGVEAGTVVVTTEGVNGMLSPTYALPILGEMVERPSLFEGALVEEFLATARSLGVDSVAGKTVGTDCFYEGQARLDGAICDYTDADKMAFLQRCFDSGVRNMEMESPVFGAFTHRLGIRAACVCVSLLDRLKGDQHYTPHEQLEAYDALPGDVVLAFIADKLVKEPII